MTTEVEELRAALVEVQSQLSFQEDAVQALNQAVSDQQQAMLVLQRQLALLKQRLDEQLVAQQDSAPASVLDEKPPHY